MMPGDQQLWYEMTIFLSSLRLNVSVSKSDIDGLMQETRKSSVQC